MNSILHGIKNDNIQIMNNFQYDNIFVPALLEARKNKMHKELMIGLLENYIFLMLCEISNEPLDLTTIAIIKAYDFYKNNYNSAKEDITNGKEEEF